MRCAKAIGYLDSFVDFFFRERLIDAQQMSISREYRFEDSRPDFLLETGNPKDFFIVEVKVNDRKQHFEQYENTLKRLYHETGCDSPPNDELRKQVGYISNYVIKPHEIKEAKGFEHTYTWQEFYSMLERYDWLGDESIRGYGQLVKGLCRFVDIQQYSVKLEHFIKINESRKWIEKVVSDNDCNVVPYNGYYQQASIRYCRIGRFFEVKNYTGKESVWGWFGVYLVESGAECVIAFEDKKEWGDLVCKHFKAFSDKGRNIEYDEYDGSLYFYMNGEFNEDNLRRFFCNAIRFIRGDEKAFRIEPQSLAKCDEWLAMLKFPALIKSELFVEWSDGCNDVSLSESGMNAYEYAWNASSSCLEWFKMSFKQHGSGVIKEVWGFVGVAWDKCQWIGRDLFSQSAGKPVFVVGLSDFWKTKEEKKKAEASGWIEQKEQKTWVTILDNADLNPVRKLRARFQGVLNAVIQ